MGETKTLDVHISNIRKKIKSVTSKNILRRYGESDTVFIRKFTFFLLFICDGLGVAS